MAVGLLIGSGEWVSLIEHGKHGSKGGEEDGSLGSCGLLLVVLGLFGGGILWSSVYNFSAKFDPICVIAVFFTVVIENEVTRFNIFNRVGLYEEMCN